MGNLYLPNPGGSVVVFRAYDPKLGQNRDFRTAQAYGAYMAGYDQTLKYIVWEPLSKRWVALREFLRVIGLTGYAAALDAKMRTLSKLQADRYTVGDVAAQVGKAIGGAVGGVVTGAATGLAPAVTAVGGAIGLSWWKIGLFAGVALFAVVLLGRITR